MKPMPAKEFYKLKKGDKVHLKWCKNDNLRNAQNTRIDDTVEVDGIANSTELYLDKGTFTFDIRNLSTLNPDDNIVERYEGTTYAYYPEEEDISAQLIQQLADKENIIKRLRSELANSKTSSEFELIKLLLPAIQEFERATKHYTTTDQSDNVATGFVMAYSKLVRALYDKGLRNIETVGNPFDYNLHNAVTTISDASVPDGIIMAEASIGYMYNDVVLKHSDVVVNSNK